MLDERPSIFVKRQIHLLVIEVCYTKTITVRAQLKKFSGRESPEA
jgi:hypothetical protein